MDCRFTRQILASQSIHEDVAHGKYWQHFIYACQKYHKCATFEKCSHMESEGSMKNSTKTDTQDRDKGAKFVELANKRVNKAVKDISLIGNLANRRNYTYNEEQAKKIIKALQASVDQVKASFLSGIHGQQANFEL
jgi:hypothetical protein